MNSPLKFRIGIDGRALHGARTGVGRYVFEFCRQLHALFPAAEFFVYSNKPLEMPVKAPNWHLRLEDKKQWCRLPAGLWVKLRCGVLTKGDGLDVFWGNTGFLPHLHRSVKTVVTVHDFNYILVPKTMGFTHFLLHKFFFARDVKRADLITTNSHATEQKVKHYLGRSNSTVILPGVADEFHPIEPVVADQAIAKYGVKRPYLLAVATLEPRKNLPMLIAAYARLKEEGMLPGYQLVLVGKMAWKKANIAKALAEVEGKDIVLTGFVDDADLPSFYSAASLFVFPSIYEGFGFPVVEAINCGCRVLASDIPELRESGGNRATFCSPDLASLVGGIQKALSMGGSPVPAALSWSDSGRVLAEAMAGLVKSRQHVRG